MTLDALSGGRAILGIGAGHVQGEFALLGIPFAERGRRTDAALETIAAKFADEWATGDGGQRPRPVQPGGPPIWVGGSSPAAIRRAARLGNGWLPQGPPKGGMPAAIDRLRRAREEAGRGGEPFAIGGGAAVYVGELSDPVPPGCVTGKPGRIAEHVRAQAALGVTHLQIRVPARSRAEMVDQIAAFAAEVVPLTAG
jgi:alkanesulfonate monooxygenase SsuD/methylene tetrahydromethanopterin reductase-like flavin-dependent oxidoreductase (luciferase family)